ncbi:MAG: hypothetical protein ABSG68_17325 [Thermoguttaceae bacterium]|jgi:hypothetical protein
MSCEKKTRILAWVGLALVGGLILGGFWPHTPLHASATDRYDTFAIATGALDDNIEAIYFLDFLTGDLRAAAVSRQLGKFHAFYTRNILEDLQVDPAKNPRYLMVTGYTDVIRTGGGRIAPSKCMLYVAEITTGKVAAYFVPWSSSAHLTGTPIRGEILLADVARFRGGAAPPAGAAKLK